VRPLVGLVLGKGAVSVVVRREGEESSLRCRQSGGYILLLSLVVAGVGMAAAALAFAVARSGLEVTAADARHELAVAAADGALRDVVDRLVWGGLPDAWRGEAVSRAVDDLAGATTSVGVQPAGPDGDARSFVVEARAVRKGAAAGRRVEIRVLPHRLPGGLTCSGDLRAVARLSLVGCGAYVGGDVFGREHIAFPDAGSVDAVRGDEWSIAAVHAGGRIHAAGREVHEAGVATPDDTDACVSNGDGPVAGWPADAEWWAGIAGNAEGVAPGRDEAVDLAALAASCGGRSFPAPTTGPVVLLEPASGEVRLTGRWPIDDGSPQATLVVRGDCVLGEVTGGAGAAVLRGSLLVDGTLTVRAQTVVRGFIAADELRVEAPLSVVVESEWRLAPPPGSWVAVGASAVHGREANPSGASVRRAWTVAGCRRMRSRRTERVTKGRRRRQGRAMSMARPHDMNDVARPDNVLVPGGGGSRPVDEDTLVRTADV
jgi:hypothetical protein